MAGPLAGAPEYRILGYRLHPITKAQLLGIVVRDGPSRQRVIIASANLHGLLMHERHVDYRALHAQPETLVIVDGMPLIWLLRAFGHPVGRDRRTTWLDWFEDALLQAERMGRRVFILGHAPDVLRAGLLKAARSWPRLTIDGIDGFFDLNDRNACLERVRRINEFAPDILFVGMGMPRQERFAKEYGPQLDAPVIGLGGAAFAYFAGDQATPPRWMGRSGLEWLHRLASDPRRLAARYLLEPFQLAFAIARRSLRWSEAAKKRSDLSFSGEKRQ